MKKSIFVFIFILLSSIFLAIPSCGQSSSIPDTGIALSMAILPDGRISQELTFSMQSDIIEKEGFSKDKAGIKNNFISSLNMLRNEFYLSFLLVYSISPNPVFIMSENVAISDVYCSEEYDLVGFNIVYKNLQAYQYFQGAKLNSGNNDDKTNSQLLGKESVLFVSRKTSEGVFPFAASFTNNVGEKSTVGERYLRIYNNCFNSILTDAECEKLESPSFVYDYALPYSNVRSNADIVVKSGSLYHNIWIKDKNNFKDSKIKLTSTVVYTGWWYLTLLLALIFIFAIVLIIVKIKNSKIFKKKK